MKEIDVKTCCDCFYHTRIGKKHFCIKDKVFTQEHFTCIDFKKDKQKIKMEV